MTRMPIIAVTLSALVILSGMAVVSNDATAQISPRTGLCRDPGMGNELCIANIAVCDGVVVCGIQASPRHTFPATPTVTLNGQDGGPEPAGPLPCDNGINIQNGQLWICGSAVPLPSGCPVDLSTTPPRICPMAVPWTDPCTEGNPACDFIARCLAQISVTNARNGGACGTPGNGVTAPDCPPAVCAIIADCLAAGTVFASRSYNSANLRVCGVDPFDCTVKLLCQIDCLGQMGAATYTLILPDSVDICGIRVDLPCQTGITYNPLTICGVTLNPCQGRICDNPCTRAIIEALAVENFRGSRAGNDQPAFNFADPAVPTSVCGIALPDQCQLAKPGNIPGDVGDSLTGLGPYSTRHFLHRYQGFFHVLEAQDASCVVDDCDPSGPNGRYMNLDCPCPKPPFIMIPGVDTDGDGSLDRDDVDDDCDALTDDLEDDIRSGDDFNSKVADNIYIINPYQTPGDTRNTPELKLGIASVTIGVSYDPEFGSSPGVDTNGYWIDPYIGAAYACYSNSGCPHDVNLPPFPGLNAVDHPHDIGPSNTQFQSQWTSSLATAANGGNQGWVAAQASIFLPSNLYDEATTPYRWRSIPADVPKLSANLALMDHDTGGGAPDDPLGDDYLARFDQGLSFWQVAFMIGGVLKNTDPPIELKMPGDVDSNGLVDGTLEVQVGLAASPCAVDWAKQNALLNEWEISTAATHGGPPSTSTC